VLGRDEEPESERGHARDQRVAVAGVTREALYRALSDDGDPKLSTLLGVVKALGVRLSATPDETPVATKAELSRDRSTRRMRVTSGSKAANG